MDMDQPPMEFGQSFHDPGSPVHRQAVQKLVIVLNVPLDLKAELSPEDYLVLQAYDKSGLEALADGSVDGAGAIALRLNEAHARAITCIVAEQAMRGQWDLNPEEAILQNLIRVVESLA